MRVPVAPSNWHVVKGLCSDTFATAMHFTVASLDEHGAPRITPIGSLVLLEPGRGYYFENYATGLLRDLDRDPRICVMALNASRWLMLKALFTGRASEPFGVRLHGTAGARRPATAEERARFMQRVHRFRFLRGHGLLWSKLATVRDVHFDAIEPVRIPVLGDQWAGVLGEGKAGAAPRR